MTPLFKNAPKFWHFITWIKWFFRQCKYTVQRARRGYCDADTWNICDEIIPMLKGMLIQFKKEHNGVPNKYFDQTADVDLGDELFCADLQYLIDLAEELGVDEYDRPSFALWKKYWTLKYDIPVSEAEYEAVHEAWKQARHEEIILEEAKTKEFFTKFGELYQVLWW